MVLKPQPCLCPSDNNRGYCNCDSSINIFKLKLVDLLEKLENKLSIKYSKIEKIKLNLKIVEKASNNSCQCHAIVENLDGRTYQCTRKKKYGNLCGLHHNRKNSFKTIESEQKYEDYQFFLDIYSLISNKSNNDIDTNKLHKITYNYNTYLLNSSNGSVYIDDPDDYSDNSSLNDYDSLCDNEKKQFTDSLLFIGNIQELNIPFKIL